MKHGDNLGHQAVRKIGYTEARKECDTQHARRQNSFHDYDRLPGRFVALPKMASPAEFLGLH